MNPCWHVEIEDFSCYAYAETRASARWAVVSAWRKAGYGSDGRWPSPLRAVRHPRYDTHANAAHPHKRVFFPNDF